MKKRLLLTIVGIIAGVSFSTSAQALAASDQPLTEQEQTELIRKAIGNITSNISEQSPDQVRETLQKLKRIATHFERVQQIEPIAGDAELFTDAANEQSLSVQAAVTSKDSLNDQSPDYIDGMIDGTKYECSSADARVPILNNILKKFWFNQRTSNKTRRAKAQSYRIGVEDCSPSFPGMGGHHPDPDQ